MSFINRTPKLNKDDHKSICSNEDNNVAEDAHSLKAMSPKFPNKYKLNL